jgi:hypothetical protein
MPDLKNLLGEWRRSMAVHFRNRADVLDELEGHLHDETRQLTQAGHPPEQALLLALSRLVLLARKLAMNS